MSFTETHVAVMDTSPGIVVHSLAKSVASDSDVACVLILSLSAMLLAETDGYKHADGGAVDLAFTEYASEEVGPDCVAATAI